jgi:hypothetical protein
MFDIENVGIISSASIHHGGRGKLLFERPGRDSINQRAAVYTALGTESLSPVTILGENIP